MREIRPKKSKVAVHELQEHILPQTQEGHSRPRLRCDCVLARASQRHLPYQFISFYRLTNLNFLLVGADKGIHTTV